MQIRFPSDASEVLEKGAKRMTRKIRKATPVGKYDHKHKLVKSWKCTMKGWTSDNIHAEIKSEAPHFHLVNRGFCRKNHLGVYVPNIGNDLAHVGFLEKTVEKERDGVREKMEKEFYKKVCDRLG